jgi:hypothetical protein
MTRRKSYADSRRPRRNSPLAELLLCPLCRHDLVRVVAYRERTVRLECKRCELRYSLNPLDVANVLRLKPELVEAGMTERDMVAMLVPHLGAGKAPPSTEEEAREWIEGYLRRMGDAIGYAAVAEPDDTPELREIRWRITLGEHPNDIAADLDNRRAADAEG